jgi:hypothetical protein
MLGSFLIPLFGSCSGKLRNNAANAGYMGYLHIPDLKLPGPSVCGGISQVMEALAYSTLTLPSRYQAYIYLTILSIESN